jgi:hypothetical protein
VIEEEQPIDPTPPEDGSVREAEEEAAKEAGEIGGQSGQEEIDPAQRPVAEAGGGVAEGFEQAEERLVEEATTDHAEGDPLKDAGEVEANPDPATHGEADHEQSSEDDSD